VLAVAFVLAELRTAEPMLPMRLFRSRSFSAGAAVNAMLAGSLFGAVFFMAQFQQVTLHQGPLAAGVRLLPRTGTVFVIAPVAGAMITRVGEPRLVTLGLTLHGAGMLWIALVAGVGMPYGELVAPMVISGVGLSTAIPAAQNAMVSAVGASDLGHASGVFTMMRQLGAVMGGRRRRVRGGRRLRLGARLQRRLHPRDRRVRRVRVHRLPGRSRAARPPAAHGHGN